jgi:formylglycine-generating enzyme required for sulfatase activity
LAPTLLLDADALARFRREAALAAALVHRGIARVYAFAATSDRAYIAMELIAGVSLATVLARVQDLAPARVAAADWARAVGGTASDAEPEGSRGIDRVIDWVIEVADALHCAHLHGVVHRDVKPANIMVRASDLSAVLTDFGLARESGSVGVTRSGMFAGTVHYASPEQVRGDVHHIGPASDVFALGVTLYELLTFRRPFDAGTESEVKLRIERSEPRDPRRANPLVDRDLAAIVQCALQKEPGQRYASAAALRDDLLRWRRREPVQARPVPWPTRLVRWSARNRMASAFLGFVLAALVAVSTLAVLARTQASRAVAALSDFDDLALGEQLASITRRAATLVPRPADAPALTALVAPARALVAKLERIDATLTRLRARGQAREPAARALVLADHPLAAQRAALAEECRAAQELSGADHAPTRARADQEGQQRRDVAARELAALDAQLAGYRAFVFDSARDQLLHDRLEDVRVALATFAREGFVDLCERAEFAASVSARLTAAAPAWDAVSAAMRGDARYGGLQLRPQAGLVPLGQDPDSGLFEFAHERSGARLPQRDAASGKLMVGDDTGLVFVLVPPGRITHWPLTLQDRLQQHEREVALAPFLLAKYEMSRFQWQALARHCPDLALMTKLSLRGMPEKWRAPAIFVRQDQCEQLLARQGLQLPTWAQWWRAAQTDTRDGWWDLAGGAAPVDLWRYANVVGGGRRPGTDPVDANAANAFGFHNMLGNVWEWCADSLVDAFPSARADGRCLGLFPSYVRALAGGSYVERPEQIAARPDHAAASVRLWTFGVRPARALDD